MTDSARHRLVWKILYLPVKAFCTKRRAYCFDLIDVKRPYLLISNHTTNFLDVLFVGLSAGREPIAFVGSEHVLRSGLAGRLVGRSFEFIARPKGASALSTVRGILNVLKAGMPVCLFAEGNCSWDGRGIDVVEGTGSLARACGVPLVTYRIEGGYLTRPRWSVKARKGRVRGRLVGVYEPETLKKMSSREVNQLIERDIYEDAWSRQRGEMIRLKGRRPAEYLERMLYLCPRCKRVGTLVSRLDTLNCACGFSVRYTDTGFLEPAEPFETVAQWEDMQKNCLVSGDFVKSSEDGELFSDEDCVLALIEADKGARKVCRGRLIQFADRLRCGKEEFALKDITAMDIVKCDRLLFTASGAYLQIRAKGRTNLRKYRVIWQAYRNEADPHN